MRKIAIWGVVALMMLALAAVPALAARPHFAPEGPTCALQTDQSIICSGGQVSGLGNEPVTVFYVGQFQCLTKSGSNMPPGQARSVPITIAPSNGNISLPTETLSSNCHGTQTPVAPTTVTLVIQNAQGQTVFSQPIQVTT